jgi:phage N-6-adenine-methyltransferase
MNPLTGLIVKTGAAMNRGNSKQDYATPDDFFEAAAKRFGPFNYDLAARADNTRCERFITPEMDSLKQDWTLLNVPNGPRRFWLNPPYDNIGPWARKCFETVMKDPSITIVMLVPASVGANWFRDFVHRKAMVWALNGRIKFKGAKDYYPKDCILIVYSVDSGFDVWTWKP